MRQRAFKTARRQRRRFMVVPALAMMAFVLLVIGNAGAVTVPPAFFVVTDSAGANDVPGQVN